MLVCHLTFRLLTFSANRRNRVNDLTPAVSSQNSENASTDNLLEEQPLLTLLDFAKLGIATDNFSETNKIGAGGFGPVYKVIPVSEVIHKQKLTLLM